MQNRELHHHDYVLEIRNENERMSEAVDCFDINCVEEMVLNTLKRKLLIF